MNLYVFSKLVLVVRMRMEARRAKIALAFHLALLIFGICWKLMQEKPHVISPSWFGNNLLCSIFRSCLQFTIILQQLRKKWIFSVWRSSVTTKFFIHDQTKNPVLNMMLAADKLWLAKTLFWKLSFQTDNNSTMLFSVNTGCYSNDHLSCNPQTVFIKRFCNTFSIVYLCHLSDALHPILL